jgi:ATP synthase protein I
MPVADRSSPDRDMGFYFALAQTGVEMVAPIAVGAFLDSRYGWSPWATAAGAVLGMAGGLWHMLSMIRRHEERQRTQPPRDST